MTIEVVGPWVLLAVGVFMLVSGAVAVLRGAGPKKPWIWMFGLAASGVGLYGPAFLVPYARFLDPIMAMQGSPDTETYGKVFDEVGEGELPPEYQELALAYALDRPIPDMENLLETAVSAASDPGGKEALTVSLEALRCKMNFGEALWDAHSQTSDGAGSAADRVVEDLSRLDSGTRSVAIRPLLLDKRLNLTPEHKERLKSFAEPRKPRARKRK